MICFPFKLKVFSRAKSYDTAYAEMYWERRAKTEESDTAFFRNLFSRYHISVKGGTVLDLAAGPGFDLKILSSFGPKRLLWQDKMEGPYRVAREALASTAGVEFAQRDLMDLEGYEDESVDFALCRDSLYYIGNDYLFFAEVKRILKPGGVFWGSSATYEFYEGKRRRKEISFLKQVRHALMWSLYLFCGLRLLSFTPVSQTRLRMVLKKLNLELLYLEEEMHTIHFLIRKPLDI